jgi:hypothetical protein
MQQVMDGDGANERARRTHVSWGPFTHKGEWDLGQNVPVENRWLGSV